MTSTSTTDQPFAPVPHVDALTAVHVRLAELAAQLTEELAQPLPATAAGRYDLFKLLESVGDELTALAELIPDASYQSVRRERRAFVVAGLDQIPE